MHREDPEPDAWTERMRDGDFAAAWRICDSVLCERLRRRVDCSRWPRHLQFVWRGQTLENRRVLVRCYHGLGDTIQFARLLAPLRERSRAVTLWAQPALADLLASVRGVDRILPLHDGVPEAVYDVDIELMELPHALRLDMQAIPAEVPYLHVSRAARADHGLRSRACAARPRALEVGLSWRSGDWNPARSIPDGVIGRLASAPGVRWHALQYPAEGLPLDGDDLACADVHELARRMLGLDLIVSVDTMTAHLAGALGLPTWTLLHDHCDWRWMLAREDSPWYPTMRLIRQRAAGDWPGVIDEVLRRLRAVREAGEACERRAEVCGR
jgi:hypothetical protein